MPSQIKHILVPTDGSPLASKALDQAAILAKPFGAKITVITVESPPSRTFHSEGFEIPQLPELLKRMEEAEKEHARQILDAAKAVLGKSGATCNTVVATGERAYETIIAKANELGCDLIVMASHGRSGVGAVVLGSETTKVLSHSTIPVLVCR